jgi:site-specific DNA-cytosine methylase
MKPLAIDLFCGLGGWTEGLLAEGYEVIGFDIEEHAYGDMRYPGKLVLQDVLTLHGSQFKDAALIVASPPCQEYSYMAMPWTRAKERARQYRAGELDVKDLTALFDAAVRIGKESVVPTVIENVRGAIPWVGRSRWNFGSYHLWGDVPALMPMTKAVSFIDLSNAEYDKLFLDMESELDDTNAPASADNLRPDDGGSEHE